MKIIRCLTSVLLCSLLAISVVLSGFQKTVLAEEPTWSDKLGDNITMEKYDLGKDDLGYYQYRLVISGIGDMKNIDYNGICNENGVKIVEIKDGVTSIGNRNFMFFNEMQTISIPNSLKRIGSHAFYECNSLSSIVIPDSVTSIAQEAFYLCRGLKNVTLSNNLSELKTYTFYKCNSIESITIPESVNNIRYDAFYACDNLNSIYIMNPLCEIDGQKTINEFATIYGYTNSPAEEYAKKYGKTFVPIGIYNKEDSSQPDKKKTTKKISTPKKTSIKKIIAKKKALKIIWKKISGINGYELQYSLKKNFKKVKTITIKKAKTTSKTIKKLKKKKKYYIRIRTYKFINGKKNQSAWSKDKSKKTK